MTRLDRLILSELIGPFIGAALLFTALFFAGGELVRIAEFLQSGESVWVVAQLILFTLPTVMALTFPMAMLLSTLLGFGRLSSDSEIIALTAAGCSFERTVLPAAALGLAVSLLGVWFGNTVVPAASRERNVIIDRYRAQGAGGLTKSRITIPLRSDPNQTIIVNVEGKAELVTGELTDVSVIFVENGEAVRIVNAPRAVWEQGTRNWKFYDFDILTRVGEGFSRIRGKSGQTEEVRLDTPQELKANLDGRPEDYTTQELREYARMLRKSDNTDQARKFEVEAARRNAVPFAAFAFGLVGAALGVRSRREGKGVGFGLSVIITFLYYVGLNVVTILARNGAMPAPFALMLPNVIGFIVGVFLIRRVMRG
ncbi:MAG: LPS export ABC transporter permease LptG [Armatimonadaceae bacterium]